MPFTLDKFDDFFAKLPQREESERSWTVEVRDVVAKNYDLKAVNPNAPDTSDRRTPSELLAIVEEAQREIASAIDCAHHAE